MAGRTTAAFWVKDVAAMLAAEGIDGGALFVAIGIDAAALDLLADEPGPR
jgi:hypothetical protein